MEEIYNYVYGEYHKSINLNFAMAAVGLAAFNAGNIHYFNFGKATNSSIPPGMGSATVRYPDNDIQQMCGWFAAWHSNTTAEECENIVRQAEYIELYYYRNDSDYSSYHTVRLYKPEDPEPEDPEPEDPEEPEEPIDPSERSPKWRVAFTSEAGADCEILIYELGYNGDVIDLIAAGNPLSIKEEDNTDLLSFVRKKTGYIRLIEEHYGDLDELRPQHTLDRYVTVGYGDNFIFTGYIQCQEFQNSYEERPCMIEFPIISCMGLIEDMKFHLRETPGVVTFQDIFIEIRDSVLSEQWYISYPKLNGNLLDCKAFSTLIVPFNNAFKFYDQKDALYKPETLSFFIEGLCAWGGWMFHDMPEGIVFQSIGDSAFTNVSFDEEIEDNDAETNDAETRDFWETFTACAEGSTTVALPIETLTLNASGGKSQEDLSTKYSQFIRWIDNGTLKRATLTYIAPDVDGARDTGGRLSSNFQNPSGLFPYGRSKGVTIGNYNKWLSNNEEWIYKGDGSDGQLVISKKFYSMRYADKAFCVKVELGSGSELDEMSDSYSGERTGRLRIKHGNKVLEMDTAGNGRQFFKWVENGGGLQVSIGNDGKAVINTNLNTNYAITLEQIPCYLYDDRATDPSFDLIEMSLYLKVGNGKYVKIKKFECSDYIIEDEELGYVESARHKEKIDIKTSRFGVGKKSLTLNFQNFQQMHTNNFIGTDGIFPRYSNLQKKSPYHYIFKPQAFLKVEVLGPAITEMDYQTNWAIDGKIWKILADSFDPRDDKHEITLFGIE